VTTGAVHNKEHMSGVPAVALSATTRRALRIAFESVLVGVIVAIVGTLIVAFMRYIAERVRTGGTDVMPAPHASMPHLLLTGGALFLTGAAVHSVASVSGAYRWLGKRDRACQRVIDRERRRAERAQRRRRQTSPPEVAHESHDADEPASDGDEQGADSEASTGDVVSERPSPAPGVAAGVASSPAIGRSSPHRSPPRGWRNENVQ